MSSQKLFLGKKSLLAAVMLRVQSPWPGSFVIELVGKEKNCAHQREAETSLAC